jgi:acyl phosphate:glycerol-3-phosphate acyltransferase
MFYVFSLKLDVIFIPLIALVAGHNFSIWLKFKGGRGLATAAGVFFVLNFWVVIIWCVIYLLMLLVKKDVHIDNTVATVLVPFVVLILNSYGLIHFVNLNTSDSLILFFCTVVCILIFLKHISSLLSIIRKSE